MIKLSIVIPTFNEAKNLFFLKNLNLFSSYEDLEIIISDGGSTDDTFQMCQQFNLKFLKNKTLSRAERINWGILASTGETILLVHPRTEVNKEAVEYLLENVNILKWGGFLHAFDFENPILKFTSWYSNNVRANLKGILYLDHCIFINKRLAQKIGQLPAVDIFEDTILSEKLLYLSGKPNILPFKIKTSAVRFKTNGILKQSLLNQILKLQYLWGIDHQKMNKLYEKKTKLNAIYDDV